MLPCKKYHKKMRFRFVMNPVRTLLLLMVMIAVDPLLTSAHFFPNATAVPPSSSAANNSSWDGFHSLIGCRKGIKAGGLEKLKKYFQYFGYLNASYDDFSDDFDDHLDTAVRNYQLNFNLNATGELDETTLDRIVQPRCGNPDIVNGTTAMHSGKSSNTFHTVAHYSFFPNRLRWPEGMNQLTYAFLPENQIPDDVQAVFARAFERWSEVTTLTFVETEAFADADITIGFYSGDHGDGEPFDGVLGTLAHAFAPPSGMFHLDGDETWVIDGGLLNSLSMSAVDLESVAVHEIGHVLGLGHSSVPESIMYPTIAAGTRKVELDDDDIAGIQDLYGANPNFNGSEPASTPRDQRDADLSGAPRLTFSLALIVGFLIFVLFF